MIGDYNLCNLYIYIYIQFPGSRSGHTKFIVDSNGHLRSQNRSPSSPWGNFVGTWQRPKKSIQLLVKTKYMIQATQPTASIASPVASYSPALTENHLTSSQSCRTHSSVEHKTISSEQSAINECDLPSSTPGDESRPTTSERCRDAEAQCPTPCTVKVNDD